MSQEDMVIDLGYPEDESIYPIKREEVTSVPSPMTISDLMLRIKEGDIDLRPNYQRGYVWKDDKATAIIDSLWNGIPIPQIFLLEKEDGKLEVIDGQQRITSIARFMTGFSERDEGSDDEKTEYNLMSYLMSILPQIPKDKLMLKVPLSLFDAEALVGKLVSYGELDSSRKRKFKNFTIQVVIIKPNSSIAESKISKIVIEIFRRLNTGGIKLTDQEIRQSIFQSKMMDVVKDFGSNDEWLSLLPIDRQKKYSEDNSLPSELVLRCFSLLDAFGESNDKDSIGAKVYRIDGNERSFEYKPTFRKFFDEYSLMATGFSIKDISERKSLFQRTLNFVSSLPNKEELFYYRSINGSEKTRINFNGNLIEVLFVGIMNSLRIHDNLDLDVVSNKIKTFKEDGTNIDNIIRISLSDVQSVGDRIRKGFELFK